MPQPARRPSRPAAAQTPVPGAVVVATDGSCKPNPGPAGWAWYVDDGRWQAGAMARETNQVAELVAVCAALRVLPVDVALHIRSDSQYAINSATAWVAKWKANGWRSSTGQPVMNLGWVQEIDRALADRRAPTTWEWVKGHNGDRMNEAADLRCGAAREAFQAGRPVPKGPGWSGR